MNDDPGVLLGHTQHLRRFRQRPVLEIAKVHRLAIPWPQAPESIDQRRVIDPLFNFVQRVWRCWSPEAQR